MLPTPLHPGVTTESSSTCLDATFGCGDRSRRRSQHLLVLLKRHRLLRRERPPAQPSCVRRCAPRQPCHSAGACQQLHPRAARCHLQWWCRHLMLRRHRHLRRLVLDSKCGLSPSTPSHQCTSRCRLRRHHPRHHLGCHRVACRAITSGSVAGADSASDAAYASHAAAADAFLPTTSLRLPRAVIRLAAACATSEAAHQCQEGNAPAPICRCGCGC